MTKNPKITKGGNPLSKAGGGGGDLTRNPGGLEL